MLEERKGELLQALAREQEQKLQRVRGLIRQYGDHLEASSKLVESAIQSMEEPQMALYLQVGPRWLAGCAVARAGAPPKARVQGRSLAPTCPPPPGLGPVTPSESALCLGMGMCAPCLQTLRDAVGIRSGPWPAVGPGLLSPSSLPPLQQAKELINK